MDEWRNSAANRIDEATAAAACQPPPPAAASANPAASSSNAPVGHVESSNTDFSHAQRLFADGVAIILAFLPLRDTALAIRCCRTWLAAAAKELSRGVVWRPHVAEECMSEYEEEGRRCVKTEEEERLMRLLWPLQSMPRLSVASPLRHHITRVELRRVDWTALQQLASLPNLRSARLTLDLKALAEEAKQTTAQAAATGGPAAEEIDARLQLRLAHVEDLTLHLQPLPARGMFASILLHSLPLLPGSWARALHSRIRHPTAAGPPLRTLHRVLDGLRRHSTRLSSLGIHFLRHTDREPFAHWDLSPLLTLAPRLTSLALAGLEPSDELITVLRRLSSLRRLDWVDLGEQGDLRRLLTPDLGYGWSGMEELRTGRFVPSPLLPVLRPLGSSLTALRVRMDAEEDWPLLARFTRLRSLACEVDDTPPTRLWCGALAQLTRLTRLDLPFFTLDEAAAQILLPPLTQLHTLRLEGCDMPDWSVLRLAPALTDLSAEPMDFSPVSSLTALQ